MATNIQKEALELFGTPTGGEGLMTFDPESYSRAVGLPGTEDISGPSPLSAIATRESRTYTPLASRTNIAEESIQAGSAFLFDINVAAPSPDDFDTINDVQGFENVSPQAIKSLGLVGMTPSSLTKTAQNLLSLNTESILNNATSIATRGTPVAAALGIAEKALNGAFQRGLQQGNSKQIAEFVVLGNLLSNISVDSLLSAPEKVKSNVEGFFTGLAEFIENPLETLEGFIELAGNYTQYGTSNPSITNYTINGISQGVVRDEKGNIVVDMPGFVKSFTTLAQMNAPIAAARMIADFIGGETSRERAERMAENMSIASEIPSFTGKVGDFDFGITSVPSSYAFKGVADKDFGSIISVDLSQYALAGPGRMNIDMAEFARTGTIDGAVLDGQSFIGPEDEELAEQIGATISAALNTDAGKASIAFSNALAEVADLNFAQLDQLAPEEVVNGIPSNAGMTGQVVAELMENVKNGTITNGLGLLDYFETKLGKPYAPPEERIPHSQLAFQAIQGRVQQQQAQEYAETLASLDIFGQPDFLNLPTDFQNYIQEMQNATSEAIGDRYNAPEGDPNLQDIEIADAVMSITGNLTFQPQHSIIDRQVTNVVRDFMARDNITAQEAADKALQQSTQLMMDPATFDLIGDQTIDPGFGYGTSAPSIGSGGVDAASLDDAFGMGAFDPGTIGYDDAEEEATEDVSPEDDPDESGEGADTDDAGMGGEDV